jgi:rhodanese-related sulfurtransferase
MNIEQLIAENEGTIVDVRTPGEFMGGHVAGSINIPLNEVPYRMEELKNLKAPLILCCASGNRSGQVENYLSSNGFSCVNGGSWMTVNYLKSLSHQL